MSGAEPTEHERTMDRPPCIGGGYSYVGHGRDLVLLAFSEDVGWWRNSVGFTAADARRLAAELIQQAQWSEEVCDGD